MVILRYYEELPGRITMKIYLFSQETGIYQGEDFADTLAMKPECHVVPPDATTIAPPACERGEIPFFDAAEKRWEVRRFSAGRPDGR
jgi:hypothetical protein